MGQIENINYQGGGYPLAYYGPVSHPTLENQPFATKDMLDKKQDTLVSGENIKSLNEESLLGEGNLEIEGGGVTPITYSELKNLRDNNQLTPGAWYRITDYQCTTSQGNTQSAGHQFDILVRADDVNVLNENAYATHHDGDTYFANCDLASWELKYCLDNDTNRFAWADSTNGKGVIYYMKDEFGNECGYDFKNIQMKFYKITAVTTVPSALNNTYSVSKVINNGAYTITSGCTVDDNDTEFRYTFDLYTNSVHSDYSLNTASNTGIFCYGNVIEPMFAGTNKKLWINFISFRNTQSDGCYGNKFGVGNYNISFGDKCFGNKFGAVCYRNTFTNNCCHNTFGGGCYNNVSGNGCYLNTFGSGCYANKFGNNFTANILGKECSVNIFGNSCGGNVLDAYCQWNECGNNCQYNTFKNMCSYILMGNYCECLTFHARCSHITFGDSSSTKSYYRNIIIENGNKSIYLTTTRTTSSSAYLQNVKIAQGANTESYAPYRTISHNTVGDQFQTIYS